MNRIVVKSKVDTDGMLHLHLPVGESEAGKMVQVIVEPAPTPPTEHDEWRAWVQSMAGSWQGDFDRSPQGDYEQRESFE